MGDGMSDIKATPGDLMEYKDPVTGEVFKIEKTLEPLLGHVINATRYAAKEDVKKEYQPLMNRLDEIKLENEDLQKKIKTIQEANLSEDEKRKLERQQQKDEAEKIYNQAIEDVEKWKGNYFRLKMKNDILESFGDTKLNAPDEVATLLMIEGNAEVKEIVDSAGKGNGDFNTFLKLQIMKDDGTFETIEGTPKEVFSKWINQKSKLHHIANSLSSGAGSTFGGQGLTDKQKLDKEYEEARVKGDVTKMMQLKDQAHRKKT